MPNDKLVPIRPVKRMAFGVRFMKRGPDDPHVLLQILSEDDGNEYVLVPRELLANYAAEYDSPVPDYTLRGNYRKQLFALLDKPTPPSGDREAVLEECRRQAIQECIDLAKLIAGPFLSPTADEIIKAMEAL